MPETRTEDCQRGTTTGVKAMFRCGFSRGQCATKFIHGRRELLTFSRVSSPQSPYPCLCVAGGGSSTTAAFSHAHWRHPTRQCPHPGRLPRLVVCRDPQPLPAFLRPGLPADHGSSAAGAPTFVLQQARGAVLHCVFVMSPRGPRCALAPSHFKGCTPTRLHDLQCSGFCHQ